MAKRSLTQMMEEDAAAPVKPSREVLKMISQLREINEQVEQLETKAAELKSKARKIREAILPPMMDSLQLKMFRLDDGTEVERTEEIYASISKANMAAAADWMEKSGNGALVKSKIQIEFERGDNIIADLARAALKKSRIGYEETYAIHPATLKAFVKEQLEKGKKLPKAITHHIQPVVTIKRKKT